MTKFMLRRQQRETGATAIEYGLIAALVAAVLITIVSLAGVNLSTVYCSVAGQVGTATGVDGPCNDIGGGVDNPPTQCAPNGDYLGDTRWMKINWGGNPEWDYYPADASQAVQNFMNANGYEILALDVLAPDNDGLSQYDGAHYDGVVPCNGGGGNETCVSGTYTGSTDGWYWYKNDTYTNGVLYNAESADHVDWQPIDHDPYTFEQRGAYLFDTFRTNPAEITALGGSPWGEWGFGPGDNKYTANVQYEHGTLIIDEVPKGTPRAAATSYAPNGDWVPGTMLIYWVGAHYDTSEHGEYVSTNWYGSPNQDDSNPGAQKATAPLPGPGVTVETPCP